MAQKKRVLVVDDDSAIAEMLARTLGLKYEVSVAADGDAALEAAIVYSPHIILLDVGLPGMDGFAVAAALKDSPDFGRVPIIFITARDSSLDVIRGIQVGAKHYVTKPFALEELAGKVERLVPA